MQGLLLDKLAELAGLYISDLKYDKHRVYALRLLSTLKLEEYSLEECGYCLSYLLNKSIRLDSYQTAYELIQKAAR